MCVARGSDTLLGLMLSTFAPERRLEAVDFLRRRKHNQHEQRIGLFIWTSRRLFARKIVDC
jgi:hypothetical protein